MGIYPWSHGKSTQYSTAPRVVSDAVLANGAGNTDTNFADKLTVKPSEGTIFIEMGDTATALGNTVWTKLAEVDRGGVVRSLSALGVLGFVDPKTGDYVVNFSEAPEKVVRFTYREDMQKNIPFRDKDGDGKTYNTMKFDITRTLVETKSRKLGATYSFELMEDFKNELGENFEDKMVDYLTTSILTEVDGEIIDMLFNSAALSNSWDATLPATWTRGIQNDLCPLAA